MTDPEVTSLMTQSMQHAHSAFACRWDRLLQNIVISIFIRYMQINCEI